MPEYFPAPLPLPFDRDMYLGISGNDVLVLTKALAGLGLSTRESVTEMFTEVVESVVKFYQQTNNLVIDGIVGKQTKSSIEGHLARARGLWHGKSFAVFCERELKITTKWFKGIKYTKAFEPVLGSFRWPWCGATMHWCLNEFYFKPQKQVLPTRYRPMGNFTFALVEAWQMWAEAKGWYFDNSQSYSPSEGAFVLFDWNQKNISAEDNDWEDHIGCFLRKEGDLFVCAEGNTSNMTGIRKRTSLQIQGFVVIPEFTPLSDFDDVSLSNS